MRFADIPKFTRSSSYSIHVGWSYLVKYLLHQVTYNGLDMYPDFQRPHVWTAEQQSRYVEYVLKGGMSGLDIYTNCPGWHLHNAEWYSSRHR